LKQNFEFKGENKMVNTKSVFRSPEIVPFKRPKGDLDSRYMPQAYALVRDWANDVEKFVSDGKTAPVVLLGYQLKGTRVYLMLVPVEFEQVDVELTSTVLRPTQSIGEVMQSMQAAWQKIPALNP
jgi:hypothetical protein